MESLEELETVRNAIDVAAKHLENWEAVIPFSAILPYREEPEDCENILEYLKPSWTSCRVYFPLDKYPVDVLEDDSPGWDSFKKDLSLAAFNNGTVIVSNGGGKVQRRFYCTHYFLYDKRAKSENSPPVDYRKSSLHGDKKNTRGKEGKSMQRRTVTSLPVDPKDRCGMYIQIKWDDKGYYLASGHGNCMHSNHVRLAREQMPFPKRLLDLEHESILESVAEAEANHGVGRNVHFRRTGVILSRQQVAYLKSLKTSLGSALDGEESSPDAMFRFFDKTRISYCCLYHHVPAVTSTNPTSTSIRSPQSQLVHEVRSPGDGGSSTNDELQTNTMELPLSENQDLLDFADEHRQELQLTNDQQLMIGCAWVTPNEKRLFQMFPEVVHVDATADTNNENRPLTTITIRDSRGNVVTVLRVFMPNERAWAFRWLFQVVFYTLLGCSGLGRIKVVITDGDAQETSQLDLAIQAFFPRALRIRCGWHIVDRGWHRHGPKKTLDVLLDETQL
jgi:hypothetical protein